MRILASVVLTGMIFSALFAQIAMADSSKAINQDPSLLQFVKQVWQAEQKSNYDKIKESQDEIQSYNKNFIAPVYITETDQRKIAASYSKVKLANYINYPEGDFVINASAYTSAADECGKSNGVTASGKKVVENQTLACPKQYPFGTKIEIDGVGTYVCEDRGGAIKGNHFDIYVQTKKQAFSFGRKSLVARIVD